MSRGVLLSSARIPAVLQHCKRIFNLIVLQTMEANLSYIFEKREFERDIARGICQCYSRISFVPR